MNAERSIQTDGADRKLAPSEWLDVPLTNTDEGRERLRRECVTPGAWIINDYRYDASPWLSAASCDTEASK